VAEAAGHEIVEPRRRSPTVSDDLIKRIDEAFDSIAVCRCGSGMGGCDNHDFCWMPGEETELLRDVREAITSRDAEIERLRAEVARLGGVVAALEEHLFRMSLDRAGHFWACDKCPNVMWGEHFVRQCPKCKSEGPFAPSTVHRWVTANPERADELRAKHHVILAIARDCLIPPAKEPANG
jgi:hypothetical protein